MDRTRARALANESVTRGEPTAWFETLYSEAAAGSTVVPWADLVPNPHLVAWLDAHARERFPASSVAYAVADLLAPPDAWRGAFDLVAETYTLQVLPPPARREAARALAALVAPTGVLLVIARGR